MCLSTGTTNHQQHSPEHYFFPQLVPEKRCQFEWLVTRDSAVQCLGQGCTTLPVFLQHVIISEHRIDNQLTTLCWEKRIEQLLNCRSAIPVLTLISFNLFSSWYFTSKLSCSVFPVCSSVHQQCRRVAARTHTTDQVNSFTQILLNFPLLCFKIFSLKI